MRIKTAIGNGFICRTRNFVHKNTICDIVKYESDMIRRDSESNKVENIKESKDFLQNI